MRINFKKFILAIFNLLLSLALFFSWRRFILRVVGFSVGRGTTIHRGIRFFDFKGLQIGEYTTINPGCYLDSRGGLLIGSNVNISHDVKIYTMSHAFEIFGNPVTSNPVIIENDVWIFPNVLIMPGVRVGAGSVVYPGSVVVKDVPPYAICAGNPARVLRNRVFCGSSNASFPVWFGF